MMSAYHGLIAPRYFIAIFGDPIGPPPKDHIEDGRYIPHVDHWPFGIAAGDVVVLYCTGSYPGHEQEAPGIGVVIGADKSENAIRYRYLPFGQPIAMDTIRNRLLPEDGEKFEHRRFSTFWIFEIQRTSFKRLADQCRVNWP